MMMMKHQPKLAAAATSAAQNPLPHILRVRRRPSTPPSIASTSEALPPSSLSSSPSPSSSTPPSPTLTYRTTLLAEPLLELPVGPPKLTSRQLHVNPLYSIAAAGQALFLKLDIAAAYTMDTRTSAWRAASVVAAVATAMGWNIYQLLAHGCPEGVLDMMQSLVGYELSFVAQGLLLGVSVLLALWQLRMWWAVQCTALRSLLTDGSASSTSASSEKSLMADTLTFLTASSRLVQLHAAACTVTTSCSSTAPLTAAILYCFSLAPLVLVLTIGKTLLDKSADAGAKVAAGAEVAASDSPETKSAALLLGTVVTADAAFLALIAAAPTGGQDFGLLEPLALVALAIIQAGCLAVAPTQALFTNRLDRWRAAKGKEVEIHVSVALSSTGTVVDTTHGKQPLRVKVGSARSSFGLAPRVDVTEATEGEATEATEGEAASSSSSTSAADVPDMGRFRTALFADIIDHVLPDMLVGQRCSNVTMNPPKQQGGYHNPALRWWQPLDEVRIKFKGRVPGAGRTFWYPLGVDGGLAPVRVNTVAKDFVELDGNVELEGTDILVHVDLVAAYDS